MKRFVLARKKHAWIRWHTLLMLSSVILYIRTFYHCVKRMYMFEHIQKTPGYPEGTVLVYFVTFAQIVMLFPWYFTLSFGVPFVCTVMQPFFYGGNLLVFTGPYHFVCYIFFRLIPVVDGCCDLFLFTFCNRDRSIMESRLISSVPTSQTVSLDVFPAYMAEMTVTPGASPIISPFSLTVLKK